MDPLARTAVVRLLLLCLHAATDRGGFTGAKPQAPRVQIDSTIIIHRDPTSPIPSPAAWHPLSSSLQRANIPIPPTSASDAAHPQMTGRRARPTQIQSLNSLRPKPIL